MEPLTVGQAAEHTGLSPKAIRLYERRGLLTPAGRTDGGYRLFDNYDLAVLGFIRQARALGLGLSEIKTILDLQRGGQKPCDHVTALLDTHLTDIDRKLSPISSASAAHSFRHAKPRNAHDAGETTKWSAASSNPAPTARKTTRSPGAHCRGRRLPARGRTPATMPQRSTPGSLYEPSSSCDSPAEVSLNLTTAACELRAMIQLVTGGHGEFK